jgi:hypothetical protein
MGHQGARDGIGQNRAVVAVSGRKVMEMAETTDVVEQLAVMRNVKFGVSDRGEPAMMFSVYTSELHGTQWHLTWEDAGKWIKAFDVGDVKLLEGKTCWVDVSKQGLMIPLRPAVL